MEGDRTDTGDFSWQEDPLAGIIPRALHQLFEQLNSMEDCAEFSVRVSFLEIYNEELFDLLGNSLDTQKLRLFEDTAKKVTSFPRSFKIVFSKSVVTRNKDSTETWAELVIVSILLYHASKCKHTNKQQQRLFMDPHFYLFSFL